MSGPSRLQNRVGAAVIALAVVLALVVTLAIVELARAPVAHDVIHDLAALPENLHVCRRNYVLSRTGLTTRTASAISSHPDLKPPIVDPGVVTGCPPSPSSKGIPLSDVSTVLDVRVGTDGVSPSR